jgi:long-subunit fatty acid transport protein
MIKYSKFFITILLAVIAFGASAQSTATSSSPYSRYGLGDITPTLLPQNIAMGGIATAINSISGYSNINPLNPASYGAISLTTIDAGLYNNTVVLSQTGQGKQANSNFRISHIAFAIPVTKGSALSFGLLPYSEIGYNYKQTLSKGFGTGSPIDTNTVNYLYNGEGGLSKAYFGYGVTIVKHLMLGANVSYIFGNLKQIQSTEIPGLYGALSSRDEHDNSIGGFNYDYGAQYTFDLSSKKHLTLGYSASASSQLNTQTTHVVSQYTATVDYVAGVALDSVINQQSVKSKIQLPQVNHFGIAYQQGDKLLIGADYTLGNWSNLTIAGVNQGLLNSKTFNVGGQFTPNINDINNYWSRVDYRLGAMFDQSYLNISNPDNTGNTNIKSYTATFGLGLPLRSVYSSFYKINISAEVGQRGTVSNGLVRENYFNLYIGFTLNDKWFQKYKFD